jgi:hypothetical protein
MEPSFPLIHTICFTEERSGNDIRGMENILDDSSKGLIIKIFGCE